MFRGTKEYMVINTKMYVVIINIWYLLLDLWPHSGISGRDFWLVYLWNDSASVIVTVSLYWLSCSFCNISCIYELINLKLPLVKFIVSWNWFIIDKMQIYHKFSIWITKLREKFIFIYSILLCAYRSVFFINGYNFCYILYRLSNLVIYLFKCFQSHIYNLFQLHKILDISLNHPYICWF